MERVIWITAWLATVVVGAWRRVRHPPTLKMLKSRPDCMSKTWMRDHL